MNRRRVLQIVLSVLGLFLVGTVVVLSSISIYLSIDKAAYLTEEEVVPLPNGTRWNASDHGQVERIPRILHQTWKTETLPDRWVEISKQCREIMPDYEYKLWTDEDSREFIANEYPWFIDTFDAYTYPIQRADAIRYFVLYHYGGIYLDLDVGCRRPLDTLLVYPVILPRTIPVGVSNDIMFTEKGHPFFAQTIHNLATFDHSWILNYPTVMFSTGPMFLSIQYGIWTAAHPPTPELPGGEVRILSKPLYGKNAKPWEAPHSFFSHFYGSSWHADDAAFIGFLGKWGKGLMWIGLGLLIFGVAKLILQKKVKRTDGAVRIGGYQVLLPHFTQRNGRWNIDLGPFTLTARGLSTSQLSSPVTLEGSSEDEETLPILPLSFDVRPPSPTSSESSYADTGHVRLNSRGTAIDSVLRVGNRAMSLITGHRQPSSSSSRRASRGRGVLFFLPAIFTPNATPLNDLGAEPPHGHSIDPDGTEPSPSAKIRQEYMDAMEAHIEQGSRSAPRPHDHASAAPPPYASTSSNSAGQDRSWTDDGGWEEWGSH